MVMRNKLISSITCREPGEKEGRYTVQPGQEKEYETRSADYTRTFLNYRIEEVYIMYLLTYIQCNVIYRTYLLSKCVLFSVRDNVQIGGVGDWERRLKGTGNEGRAGKKTGER